MIICSIWIVVIWYVYMKKKHGIRVPFKFTDNNNKKDRYLVSCNVFSEILQLNISFLT